MAMVISQTTKAAIGGFLALMILGAVLVVGAAFGWFDPKREDEDTPAKISARLQGRTSFVTHRAHLGIFISQTCGILIAKIRWNDALHENILNIVFISEGQIVFGATVSFI
ncbi:unnamed protein product [Euphydryas editha]|uniref:Uncharacterized protein n=1 Tax=Euphydryas editha TaxID=104508 RepID=A0AAU9U0T2_EUPED|nr:unnamed protein product [Euphydryas editha]